MNGTLEERFWAKVERRDPDECWLWTGALMSTGYGSFNSQWPRPSQLAHRVVYEMVIGPIPEGLTVDHLCRTRRCVNPAHLEAVTLQVNIQRAHPRKTHCIRGHAFDAENTYLRPDNGVRQCKACGRLRVRARA